MELKQSNIILIEDTHTYLDANGKNYEGITSTVIKALCGDYTKDIPEPILREAQERGTAIHNEIARIDAGESFATTREEMEYLRLMKEEGLVPFTSEYIVSDFKYFASPIDKVCEGDIIIDIKTSAAIHWPELIFQLSWYATYYLEMNERPVQKAYVMHLPKEQYDECKLLEVPLVSPDIIKEIIEAYINHEDLTQYGPLFGVKKNTPVQASTLPAVINTITRKMLAYEHKMNFLKKEYDEYKEQYKAALIEYFVQSGERKIEYDGDTITYIAPTTRVSIDGKGLKADHPEIYKQYMKETVVGESIRIKLK